MYSENLTADLDITTVKAEKNLKSIESELESIRLKLAEIAKTSPTLVSDASIRSTEKFKDLLNEVRVFKMEVEKTPLAFVNTDQERQLAKLNLALENGRREYSSIAKAAEYYGKAAGTVNENTVVGLKEQNTLIAKLQTKHAELGAELTKTAKAMDYFNKSDSASSKEKLRRLEEYSDMLKRIQSSITAPITTGGMDSQGYSGLVKDLDKANLSLTKFKAGISDVMKGFDVASSFKQLNPNIVASARELDKFSKLYLGLERTINGAKKATDAHKSSASDYVKVLQGEFASMERMLGKIDSAIASKASKINQMINSGTASAEQLNKAEAQYNQLQKIKEGYLNNQKVKYYELNQEVDKHREHLSEISSPKYWGELVKRAIAYYGVYQAITALQQTAMGGLQFAITADTTARTFAAISGTKDYNTALIESQKLTGDLIGLNKKYGDTLENVSKVALTLARAGVAEDKIVSSTEAVMRLARLTGDTIESSVGALVTYSQVYGEIAQAHGETSYTIEQLGDKLGWLANESKFTTQDISTFANYVLSTASAMGVTIDATNALASSFNKAGQGASTTATQIRTLLIFLSTYTEETQDFYNRTGISQQKLLASLSKGGEESNAALMQVVKRLSTLTNAEFTKIISGLDKNTRTAITSIRRYSSDIVDGLDKSINESEGSLKRADIVFEGFTDNWNSLKNTVFDAMATAITPALKEMNAYINELKSNGGDLSTTLADWGKNILAVAEGFAIFWATTKFLEFIVLIKEASVAFGALRTVLAGTWIAAALAPVAAIAGAILGVTGAVWALKEAIDAYKDTDIETNATTGELAMGMYSTSQATKDTTKAIDIVSESTGNAKLSFGELSKSIRETKKELDNIKNSGGALTTDASTDIITSDTITKIKQSYGLINSSLLSMNATTSSMYKEQLDGLLKSAYGTFKASAEQMQGVLNTTGAKLDISALLNLSQEDLTNGTKVATVISGISLAIDSLAGDETTRNDLKARLEVISKFLSVVSTGTGTITKTTTEATEKGIKDSIKSYNHTKDNIAAKAEYNKILLESVPKLRNASDAEIAASEALRTKEIAQLDLNKAQETYNTVVNKFGKNPSNIEQENAVAKARNDLAVATKKAADANIALTDSTASLNIAKITKDTTDAANALSRKNDLMSAEQGLAEAIATRVNPLLTETQIALTAANVEYNKTLQEKSVLESKSAQISKELLAIEEKMAIIEKSKGAQAEEYIKLSDEKKAKLNEYSITQINLDKQEVLIHNARMARIKAEQIANGSLYEGFQEGVRDYIKTMDTEFQKGERLAKAMASSMESAFADFFDSSSDEWLDLGSLAKKVLNDIKKELIKSMVVQPLTSSFMSLLGGGSGGSSGGLNLSSLTSGLNLFGAGASLVGTTLSASEVSSLASAEGTVFDDYSGTMQTAGGTIIDSAGTVTSAGSDIGSLVSNLSTLKTAYGLLTNGVSGTIAGGFNSVAGGLGSLGFEGAGTWLSQFGGGFASPLSTNGASALAGSSTGLGAVAGSAALGYGMGSIGDMLFGAETKAGIGGAIGGAIGSILGGPIGGAIVGSLIGGLFGSTKQTDAGLSFGQTTGNGLGFDSIQSYADMKKKSWFSSKSWTDYTDLSASDKAKIEGIFSTYDYLLLQLGETEKITLAAGKYTGETFGDELSKNFITAFTDISQNTDDAIYQTWKDYAESVDKTVMEALSESVNTFVQSKRTFEIWDLGANSVEALAKQAEWAQADLKNLENMVGVTGLTVDNFLSEYDKAVKENFTPETITQWDSLGKALMSATDAQKAYTDSLASAEDAYQNAINANMALNAKNIQAIVDSLSLQGLTASQTFEQLTNMEVPTTLKQWEEAGELLAKRTSVLSQEVLTAFQNIGLEIKANIEAIKEFSQVLINSGDILGSVANSMKLSELNYNDYKKADGSFNAGAFNIAYSDEKAKLTIKALGETSTNALKIQNAFQSFTDAYKTLPQFNESGPLAMEYQKAFKSEFFSISTAIGDMLQGYTDSRAMTALSEQFRIGGQGIAGIYGAQANFSQAGAMAYRDGNLMYGEKVIALYDAQKRLNEGLKNNIISTADYTQAMDLLAKQSVGTIEVLYDYEEQQRRMIAAQEAIYTAAANSSKYYFSEIVKASDGLQIAAQEVGAAVGIVVQTVGRLASLTDVLKFSADNIGFKDKDSIAIKEMSYLISDASKFLSAQLTTADAKQAAETLAEKESFANVDAIGLRNLSLMFEGLSAYDATAMENLFTQLNAYLIKGDITDAQYVDVFNTALDVYREGNEINEEQLETLKRISSAVIDIYDYQRELLMGDLSPMDSVNKYLFASQETMSVAQQAKDAMALGDMDKFTDLFESYKQVSTDFLELSQSLSANNATYMNDFTKVYSALEEMKALATTGSANAIAPLSQDYFKLDGSHASGLDYVPFDGYVAELHKGERVQTASQANQNDMVAQELKALREDLKTANSALAQHMAKTAKILDRWEGDGMPEVRTA